MMQVQLASREGDTAERRPALMQLGQPPQVASAASAALSGGCAAWR
jgi:hypothetical protein